MSDFSTDTLMHRMAMRVETICATEVTATVSMPVAGNTQVYGYLHGGASAALAETVASLAANEYAQSTSPVATERVAVGTDLSISHLRAVKEGYVYAHASPEYVGNSRVVHRVEIYDDQKRLVATGRVTNLLINPR
ncbi:MAG: PaaI family thioesterase [Actinomycetaceae bacterium]|nr:PaaI family thioesterase [Actinomycetaceae bacterium]